MIILAGFRRFSAKDDLSFAKELIERVGVAATPVSGFYTRPEDHERGYLCFAFCKQEATLRQALERLHQLHSL
ncbi:MAG TPA: hypothetical protein DEA44_06245 [Firmicutes bacterium]|nr:hypothetical protein [Bacillota bacterium]